MAKKIASKHSIHFMKFFLFCVVLWYFQIFSRHAIMFITIPLHQAPFTPFLAENIYQHLKGLRPQTGENDQSIHFIPFPEVNTRYFDDVIVRQVTRMKSVIDLARNIREKKNISLKVLFSLFFVVTVDNLGFNRPL
jgi:valyl-tRNA synthetase